MWGKFHDENYDGVVLKVPKWFIEMNGLEKQFAEFEAALKSATKSTMYPDHLNNIHELENRAEKVEIIKGKRDEEKKLADFRTEKQNKLISGEIYELYWSKENRAMDSEFIRIGDAMDDKVPYKEFEFSDYMTDKLNVKSAFIKQIKGVVKDFASLKSFAKNNCAMLGFDMQYCAEDFIDLNYDFYCNSYAGLGITYNRLEVKTDWKRASGGLQYRTYKLVQFDDGCLAINKGGNIEDYVRLEGYTREGMYLVKKEKQ